MSHRNTIRRGKSILKQFTAAVLNSDQMHALSTTSRFFGVDPCWFTAKAASHAASVIGRFIFNLIRVNFSWVGHKLANNVTESILAILPKTFSLIKVKWGSVFKLFLTDKSGSNAVQWQMIRNPTNSYLEISFALTDSHFDRNFWLPLETLIIIQW